MVHLRLWVVVVMLLSTARPLILAMLPMYRLMEWHSLLCSDSLVQSG